MRAIKWIILLALLAGLGWIASKWYQAQGTAIEAFRLVPPDAIYCISTDDPIETWKEIAQSRTWGHLQKNSYFASITASANSLDSLIRQNDFLFTMIGSRKLVVSAHMTGPKKYDFLFLVDLKEVSGIKFLNDYLTGVSAEGYTIHTEKHGKYDLTTLHKDSTDLFISFPGTNLVASFTKKLVTASLDTQDETAKINSGSGTVLEKPVAELEGSGMMRLYVNYSRLPQFMTCYTDGANEFLDRIGEALLATGLSFSLEGDLMKASGITYVNDSVESYLKALEISGKGPTEILQMAPQRTAFYAGFGFSSFPEFFSNFEKNLQQDIGEYKTYRANLKAVEDYLKVSLQEDFIQWIGEEVALIELQSSGGLDNEVALVLKAADIEKARKGLAHIEKMVRRRTPVKFKEVDHKGYKINYLSMKGLFKVVFGKFFARYDKPYYTIINNFVIFSNHPQTLESIIDDYLGKNTLVKSDEFRSFRKEFEDEGSVLIFVNTPVFFNSMKTLMDRPTRSSMERNKEFIVCFRQLGFQLTPGDGKFKTTFAEQFVEPVSTDTAEAIQPAADTVDSDSVPPAPEVETDPMALPYIYVQDVNADSYKAYFPDSTIHLEVRIKNGFKNGAFTEYYPNGEVKMKGHFSNDKREGTWRLFDETGKEILNRKYDADEIVKEKRVD